MKLRRIIDVDGPEDSIKAVMETAKEGESWLLLGFNGCKATLVSQHIEVEPSDENQCQKPALESWRNRTPLL